MVQDYAAAIGWFRKATEQGESRAPHALGATYMMGLGVIQDDIKAHMWYNIASANGNPKSAKFRDAISEGLSREDLATAQAMANTCMSSGYKDCGW